MSIAVRPMTRAEIDNFGKVPEGATFYPNLATFNKRIDFCVKNNIVFVAHCSTEEGIYWVKEGTND